MRSMTGLQTSPGTAVLPMCWISPDFGSHAELERDPESFLVVDFGPGVVIGDQLDRFIQLGHGQVVVRWLLRMPARKSWACGDSPVRSLGTFSQNFTHGRRPSTPNCFASVTLSG